jgi:hypothetical protein
MHDELQTPWFTEVIGSDLLAGNIFRTIPENFNHLLHLAFRRGLHGHEFGYWDPNYIHLAGVRSAWETGITLRREGIHGDPDAGNCQQIRKRKYAKIDG